MKFANLNFKKKVNMGLFDFLKKPEVNLDENLSKEVQLVREEHKAALRERLEHYRLSKEEIDNLFLIFTKAEEKIEKIQKNMNYKTAQHIELVEMVGKIEDVQNQMKEEFEEKLSKILKHKYEVAKKILEEIKKKKNEEKQ